MITGETRIIVFDLPEVDIDSVEKVNIYLANGSKTIVKTYPGDVTFSDGKFALPLLQEDTLNLGIGVVKSQAEIIFKDRAVAKTNITKINMNDALGTERVFENKPNPNQLSDFTFRIEGNVIIASVNSDLTYTKEEVNQIAESLQQNISGIIDDSKVNSATNTLSAEKISQINSKTVKDLEKKISDVINDAAEDSEDTTLSAKKIKEVNESLISQTIPHIEDVKNVTIQNEADATDEIWTQWSERLAFGMDVDNAPLPVEIDGQLFVNGTIIAHNTGNNKRNRWGVHVFEAYGKNDYDRVTMIMNKHENEENKKVAELYHFVDKGHADTSYAWTRVGSDAQNHSFMFSRDKAIAYGVWDMRNLMQLARFSPQTDVDKTYDTVKKVDNAYDAETMSVENAKCMLYLALKNAQNGAMFYDTDRDKPMIKVNNKWCELNVTEVTDGTYDEYNTVSSTIIPKTKFITNVTLADSKNTSHTYYEEDMTTVTTFESGDVAIQPASYSIVAYTIKPNKTYKVEGVGDRWIISTSNVNPNDVSTFVKSNNSIISNTPIVAEASSTTTTPHSTEFTNTVGDNYLYVYSMKTTSESAINVTVTEF